MSVSAVGGASNVSAVAVTTLTATYAPTAGNCVVVFVMTGGAVTGLVVKDSAGNTLSAGLAASNLASFWMNNVPAGITGYTATWTTGQQASIAVEEYTNAGSKAFVNVSGFTGTAVQNSASGTSSTGFVIQAISEPNNIIVAGSGSTQTMTAQAPTVGRQQTTTSTARLSICDNTAAVVGNVQVTVTLTNAFLEMISFEIGGPGNARTNQQIPLAVKQVTGSNARTNQQVLLLVKQITPNPNARVNQQILLLIKQRPKQPVIFVTG